MHSCLLLVQCIAMDGNISFVFTWEMRRKVQLGTGSPIAINSLRKRNSLAELSSTMRVCVCVCLCVDVWVCALIQSYFQFHFPFVLLCCCSVSPRLACSSRFVLVRSAAVANTHNKRHFIAAPKSMQHVFNSVCMWVAQRICVKVVESDL